jgi:hypothetical protein
MSGQKRDTFEDIEYEIHPCKKNRTLPEEARLQHENVAVACDDEPMSGQNSTNKELEEGEIDIPMEDEVGVALFGRKYGEWEDETGTYFYHYY